MTIPCLDLEGLVKGMTDTELTSLVSLAEAERYRRVNRRLVRRLRRLKQDRPAPPPECVPTVSKRGSFSAGVERLMNRRGWRFIPAARLMEGSTFIGRMGQWVRQCPGCGLERGENYFSLEGHDRSTRTPWCDPCLDKRSKKAEAYAQQYLPYF